MKTAEAKTASPSSQRRANKPFFGKGESSFFENTAAPQHGFFSTDNFFPSTINQKPVQAKLTVGRPNDVYEKEADSMADKVVQRLAVGETLTSPKSTIQSKCSTCEKEEETLHKKEDTKLKEDKKIQRKPGETEKTVQKKSAEGEPKSVKTNQATPVTSIVPSTSVVQAKCSACEQEEKLQKEEDSGEEIKKVQRKPIFDSNAEPPDDEKSVQRKPAAGDNIQRSCRECEEGDKVLMKPISGIQRSEYDQTPKADGSRESIVAAAKGELGKVEARLNDGTGKRVGSDRLLEYFHIAAPGVWEDQVIETAGAKMPSWCGIFSVWAHKKAGKDIGNWEMGKGVSAFGTLSSTNDPQPGDIGYIHKPNQHHAVVKEVQGDNILTIDGNSGLNSEVVENTKPKTAYTGFMTAFGGEASSGNVQSKDESDAPPDHSSDESSVTPSVESRINSSKGTGSPLPDQTRQNMEQSFGAGFDNVRVHTDTTAKDLSKDLSAQAFTHGSDIYFNSGKYDTSSREGQHLLAHELTHVVQQGSAQPQSTVSRAATSDTPPAGPEGEANSPNEEAVPDQGQMETELREQLSRDDMGGKEPLPGEAETQEGEGSSQSAPDGGGGSAEGEGESEGESEGEGEAEAAEEPEEAPDGGLGPEEEGEEGGSDSVPDGTPVSGEAEPCPRIVPDFPAPPENATIEEGEESYFEELIGIAAGSGLSGAPSLIGRMIGLSAYYVWQNLPLFIKIYVINYVLDAAIRGAYWGRIMGRYQDMGAGLIMAALTGFFRRLRRMPDVQKVRMFEKFGRIILRGDIWFMLGMLKGILMGFFLDGLLGIIQMVIDIICIVPRIINFFRTIGDFLSQLPYELELIKNSIEEMMSSVGDLITNAWTELQAMIRDPRRMQTIITNMYNAAAGAMEQAGEAMADTLIRYSALPPAALGEISGRVAGQIIFEAVLIYFSGGTGAGVTAAKLTIRAIGRALATIGRQIFRIVRALGRVLRWIRTVITRIIRFLTPLLRAVARLARRVVDRLSSLFRVFRRHCRPGSVRCKLPRPRCRGRYVPRLGGWGGHDRYVTRTTGQHRDYRLRGTIFGVPVPCNYDAKMGRLLVEGKTGYRYLPFIQHSNPSLYRMIMFRLNEQRWRCMAIAARCGYPYVWYFQERHPAEHLTYRWHGLPPVLHVP